MRHVFAYAEFLLTHAYLHNFLLNRFYKLHTLPDISVSRRGRVCKSYYVNSIWHKICICVHDHTPYKTHIPSTYVSLIITVAQKDTTSFQATEMLLIEFSLSETAEDDKYVLQYDAY